MYQGNIAWYVPHYKGKTDNLATFWDNDFSIRYILSLFSCLWYSDTGKQQNFYYNNAMELLAVKILKTLPIKEVEEMLVDMNKIIKTLELTKHQYLNMIAAYSQHGREHNRQCYNSSNKRQKTV